jgi:hypothetical protein
MAQHTFVVCINNEAYGTSLEVRKLYEVLPDAEAARLGQIRVVDESGEDYLYPQSFFAPVELPSQTELLVLRVV